MLKYRYNTLPEIFEDFYERNENVHSHKTCIKHVFRMPLISSDIRKRTVRATGVRIFNHISRFLTLNEKVESSIPFFKSCLKSYIIDNDISLDTI